MDIRVQKDAFDPGALLSEFQSTVGNAGAVVSFTGVVRDDTGDLISLDIEHYPNMTEAALQSQAQTAADRFGLSSVCVLHRYGPLKPSEPIMMVLTAAKHRKDAFAGADFLMDYLKSRAPFWKKEITKSGAAWVDAKAADEAALQGWSVD